jgi:cytidine deaminase
VRAVLHTVAMDHVADRTPRAGAGAAAPDLWARLTASATEVMARAYAPYSGYPVGAAALVDDGRTVTGCNVENAGYGVTLCAECGLVSELVAGGGGRLTHFVCVNRDGEVIMPCGRCRQLLFEHGGRDLLMMTVSGIRPMSEVLPDAFGPDDLAEVSAPAGTVASTDPEGTP